MKIKSNWALTKASLMETLTFRGEYFVTFLGNIIYLIIIYYLWKAIYASSPTSIVNGMTFYDTLIYLVLAAALFNSMEVYLVWRIGRDILSGQIINDLIKPMDFQQYMFFSLSGSIVIAFLTTFLPTLIIIFFLTKGAIVIGINLVFLIPSVMMAIAINYFIDFMVSTICLYTMSIWGINIMKEVIVLLLSGSTIPLAFFPDTLRKIVMCMPFQAIYNIPLQLLINKTGNVFDYTKMLCLQGFWVVVTLIVSRVFWKASLKIITVNGG